MPKRACLKSKLMSDKRKTVIALGFFDSVHIGHRAVISSARKIADDGGNTLTVFSFSGNLKKTINNNNDKMFGEDRLLNFLNEFKSNDDPIEPLLYEINNFTKDAEQYDDMTLMYIKIK